MIRQLAGRLRDSGLSDEQATLLVLTAPPLDLVLHMEQVWEAYFPRWTQSLGSSVSAWIELSSAGLFSSLAPEPGRKAWDHLAYSYVLENTRAVQILERVVQEFRSGESLGRPSTETVLWLGATEALISGSSATEWLFQVNRGNSEAARRNAYWRLFGLDLAFGSPDNLVPEYHKAEAANHDFAEWFEHLLRALADAFHSLQSPNALLEIDDRIFQSCNALEAMLGARRANRLLVRQELIAATLLGWVELTFSLNSPVVVDLGAEAYRPSERLRLISERVGLPAHSKSEALLSLAPELSIVLSRVEAGLLNSPALAWSLYLEESPAGAQLEAIGSRTRIVLEEWADATGRPI